MARAQNKLDFTRATDILFSRIKVQDLADSLDVGLAKVNNARQADDTETKKPPPDGWRSASIKLSEARIKELQELNAQLAQDEAAETERNRLKALQDALPHLSADQIKRRLLAD